MGLGHGLLLFQAGALPGSQPPTPGIRAEPVIRHTQHLSFESLVKMDHFQKGATAKFKTDYWGTGGVERGQYLKEQIGHPLRPKCSLWVISGHFLMSAFR